MAIAKKPNAIKPVEAEADRFIAGAGAAVMPAPTAVAKGRVAIMVRFDAALLGRVDAAAKKRGVSRSAWLQYTASEALEGQK